MKRTLVVGDLHLPWAPKRLLSRIHDAIRAEGVGRVVQVGDTYDFFSFSKHARSMDVITPRAEVQRGRELALWFWDGVRAAAGRSAELIAVRGNHDERPVKRALDTLPELEMFVRAGVEALFDFPGVRSIHDYREEFIADGVVYQHGYRKHGEHVVHNLRNTVVGHLHVGGTVFRRFGRRTLWELNAGLVADLSAPVFHYRPQKRFSPWTVGYGLVDERGPRFVPL